MTSSQAKSSRKLRILFIVDKEDQASPLVDSILGLGYELYPEVIMREEAVSEMLAEDHWDLIFCQFSEQLASKEKSLDLILESIGTSIPVVYFSDTVSEQDVSEAIRSGVTDFLVGESKIHLLAILERELNRNKFIRECGRNRERYKEIIDSSSDAIIALDSYWNINFFSKGAEDLFGYSQDEAIGKSYASLIHASKPKEHSLNHTPADTNEFNLAKRRDITIRCKDGSTLACEMNMSRTRVIGDKRIYTVILRDISDRKAKEEELIRLANNDAHTDKFNRHSFYNALQQERKQANRDKTKFALLYIDLDDFKNINDSLGHVGGDELLKEFAHRLRTSLREVDTVARMGGDEFTAILHNVTMAEHAASVANKLIDIIGKPFSVKGEDLSVGTSIGISVYPDDTEDPEKLISYADSALYKAKSSGRKRSLLYNDVITSDSAE